MRVQPTQPLGPLGASLAHADQKPSCSPDRSTPSARIRRSTVDLAGTKPAGGRLQNPNAISALLFLSLATERRRPASCSPAVAVQRRRRPLSFNLSIFLSFFTTERVGGSSYARAAAGQRLGRKRKTAPPQALSPACALARGGARRCRAALLGRPSI